MKIVRTAEALRELLDPRPSVEAAVGFVPTMGALHRGHVTLFDVARRESRTLVASIFVNPTQFNDAADLAAYPRDEEHDAALASAAGVDILFAPLPDVMYPPDFATTVSVAGVARRFEGDHRPGHFDGVATVCLKLFSLVQPHRAYFGQKDAQQVAVIQQMVRDFHLPLEIRIAPTVRDEDGLAMSSRNVRLSPDERRRALAIPRALRAGLAAHRAGQDVAAAARAELRDLDVDYAEVAPFPAGPTLVIAARAGRTRLIDNVPLHDPAAAGLQP